LNNGQYELALQRTIDTLQSIPQDLPVALLIRHSARDEIPDGVTGVELALNALGISLCAALGRALQGRMKSLSASPVLRCVQTAELLVQFSGCSAEVMLDKCLGAPGVYVLDEQLAWQNWLAHGHEGVIQCLISGRGALPGMADPSEAAHQLGEHMLQALDGIPGLHVFVSHDSIVAPTVARLMGGELPRYMWPEFLDAVALWRNADGVWASYRGAVSNISLTGL
jgi:broad specificity phosphatase PhoE